jgi:hypothetical protein
LPSFATADPEFFTEYLAKLDCSQVCIFGVKEGTVVFPRVPVLRYATCPVLIDVAAPCLCCHVECAAKCDVWR